MDTVRNAVLAPAVAALLVCGATTSCAQAGTSLAGSDAVRTDAVLTTAGTTGTARAKPPAITKVLTFVVENHSLQEMKDSMPYVYRLAKKYAYADHYRAITHPSLPNYLALFSGGTQGVVDDADPSAHPLSGRTVFDQALSIGRTATVYADAMTQPCQLDSAGRYAVRHNPWTYFVNSREVCQHHDVPVGQLAKDTRRGKLPNLGLVIPDLVNDAHDAPLGTADAWLKTQIKLVRNGPDWESGHLAIVVTADEDDYSGDNTVLTVVASRDQVQKVTHRALTHYSLTALFDAVIGAAPLGQAAGAPSMLGAFGIKVGPGH